MKVLVIGATAAIAEGTLQALCLRNAKKGQTLEFYLLARNPEKLERVAQNLAAQFGAKVVGVGCLDLTQSEAFDRQIENAKAALGEIDTVLIAHGTLRKQTECAADTAALKQVVEENFISQAVWLNKLAEVVKEGGVVGVITSVAGDAARPSSATYSAAKAALSRYMQGMRGVYWQRKVTLVDIRPGWVDTPMTAQATNKFLTVTPLVVGKDIARALERKSPAVLYTPWFWRWIMQLLKWLPAGVFKRMKM